MTSNSPRPLQAKSGSKQERTPYFSVIIPIYRCEPYVEQCLASLANQTYRDFEAIGVDDASPDESLDAAKRAVGEDERFTFYSLPENRGQSAARNYALDRANGQVIVLLDADDCLESNALELIAERMQRQQLDDLYFNAESFYENAEAYDRVVEDFSKRPDFDGVATGTELFTFFEEHGQWMPHGALRAVRRDLIERNNVRFHEGAIHEDLLFTLQTLLASKRSSFLNEPLYRRRIHTGSTMATPRRTMRNIDGHLLSIRFLRDWLHDNAGSLDERFMSAACHRIESYLNVCALDYLNDVTDDEKTAYLATLSPEEKIEFELDVVQRAALLKEQFESRTYRIGRAVTALPRAVLTRIEKAKRKR